MSTSETFASSRTSLWPSGLERSIVIDFLPRLADVKYAESLLSRPSWSFTQGGPKERESSPEPGRSTLITSAPRSARFCPAQGPASTRERSRTRMCESGPAMGFRPLETRYFIRKPRAGDAERYNNGGLHGARDAISSVEDDLRRRDVRAAARYRAATALRLRAREALGRRDRPAARLGRAGVARSAANREIPRHLHRGEEREGRDHPRARTGRASRLRPDRRAAHAARRRGLRHAFDPDADSLRGSAAGALPGALLGSRRALRRGDDLPEAQALREGRAALAQHGLAHGEPLRRGASAGSARGLDLAFHLERGVRADQASEVSDFRHLRGKRLRRRAAGRAEARRGAQTHARLEPDHGVRDRSLFRQEGKGARIADRAAPRRREEMKSPARVACHKPHGISAFLDGPGRDLDQLRFPGFTV